MLMRVKCLFPKLETRACHPPTAIESALIAWAPASEEDRSKTAKESHRGKKLFQLKREFSLVASYKINIQNLMACQTPQNNWNKIYWEKDPIYNSMKN